jgi:hypothetical protein
MRALDRKQAKPEMGICDYIVCYFVLRMQIRGIFKFFSFVLLTCYFKSITNDSPFYFNCVHFEEEIN